MTSFAGQAQQDAIYSQYMFNPFAINPAYAGSRDAVNIVVVNRSQWVGLDGAPNTQTISGHVPMNNNNIAWGFNISRDKLGPTSNLLAAGTAAYQLRLYQGTLTFGLRGGIYNSVVDHGQLSFREDDDILDNKERLSGIVPTFDFGLYYYTERFYAGLSSNHITKHRFNYSTLPDNQAYFLRRHTFLAAGYVFEVNRDILLKPSVLLKHGGGSAFNVDVNVNALFKELFWLGIGLRNLSSLNFLVDFNVTDYLRVGYSYDMTLNKLKSYSYGSHEIIIGFDFNLKKSSNILSPRYL
jgi:type IX secretion system PorP/SprF family membrane protein